MAWSTLSIRQKRIARLVAEGNTSKEIGRTLFISVETVRKHRRNIFSQLGIHSASELAAYTHVFEDENTPSE